MEEDEVQVDCFCFYYILLGPEKVSIFNFHSLLVLSVFCSVTVTVIWVCKTVKKNIGFVASGGGVVGCMRMGEVVVSGAQVVDVEMEEAKKSEESYKEKEEEEDGGSKGMVRWEKYIPRMALTVLLVEADDSTRQIIAALLRKCNYRG